MRTLLSGACAAVVAAAGLVSAAPQASAAPPPAAFVPPPVVWGPCTQPALVKAGAECGTVEAPLDYAAPDGEKVRLAVSRVRHTSAEADYQGPILVNPGGPGGSGLSMSLLGGRVPDKVGARYDWIGFDPRGVGDSRPALRCDPGYFGYRRPAYVPDGWESEAVNRRRAADYAAACGKAGGSLLRHLKTVDTVRDMETIRRALGVEQINYYGFSYGTYLAQVYATMYPQRIRRMVLDGVVDHRHVWYQANLNQDVAFERNIRVFFAWIAHNHKVFKLGTKGAAVAKLYNDTREALAKEPAGGAVGSSEFADAFLNAGYSQSWWNRTAAAFSRWVHHKDAAALKGLYDSAVTVDDDNSYAVYVGVQCTDVQWPADWVTWRKDTWDTHAKAPFYTWANTWFNAPCLTWPAPPGTPVAVDPAKAPPVLLISEEWDGATPYEGALEARRIFPNSVLVSSPEGTTHSSSLRGNACVDNRIADYLRTGALPPRKPGGESDITCKPAKKPDASMTALASDVKDPWEILPPR
ncbi:MAG TPA: alpha/beta hydrolase [Pilimelia sp.]|nr:alpha/beta hydrolase [Pilimelia sp.]